MSGNCVGDLPDVGSHHPQEAEPTAQTALNNFPRFSFRYYRSCFATVLVCKEKRSSVRQKKKKEKKLGKWYQLSKFRVSSDPGFHVQSGMRTCNGDVQTGRTSLHRPIKYIHNSHLPHCAYSSSLPSKLVHSQSNHISRMR